jgi:hypothetical protein
MESTFQAFPASGYLVSYFRNIADKEPITIDIVRFMNAIKRGQFSDYIYKIRQCKSKEERTTLKKKLPAITTAGLFENGRQLNNLKCLTDLISIDLDNIKNLKEIKEKIHTDKYTFCSFISPSGNGLKIIFKINCFQSEFKPCFAAIEKYFNTNYNIQIDKACSDITRLMFISTDKNLYYNIHSEIFTEILKTPQNINPKSTNTTYQSNYNTVEKLILAIEKHRIDITQNYQDWVKIAYALVSEFGISGLNYFHKISQYHAKYSTQETEKQFMSCYRSGSVNVSIKSLFEVAKWYGVTFK